MSLKGDQAEWIVALSPPSAPPQPYLSLGLIVSLS